MKIDYLSCTKMLYFAEKLLRDDYYDLPDRDDVFAKQFDMTANEVKEICDQFKHDKLLIWRNMWVEIEDNRYDNDMTSEFSYDALVVNKKEVEKQVEYLKERYCLRQAPFIPREAVNSIAKQIEQVFSEDEWMRAISAFSRLGWQLRKKEYTLTDLLFRHAYAKAHTQPLHIILAEFLNPIYYGVKNKQTATELFEYMDRVLSVSANKEDYQEWLKEAAKYTITKAPNLSDDFDATRRAHTSALKKELEKEDLIKEVVDRVQNNTEGEETKQQGEHELSKFVVSVKDREILINNYLISKPHGVGSNFEFFEYIRLQKPNTKINRSELPSKFSNLSIQEQVKNKSFIKILNGLGFKGELLKAFFYKRGRDTLTYRGDEIAKEDLEKAGVKTSLFLKELELAHTKNSPE